MFNSRPFLLSFFGTAGLSVVALLIAAALVDSRGLVTAAFPWVPRICTLGADHQPREFKPFVALPFQPRELLVGNSRVDSGFAVSDVQDLLGGRVANLAVEGASMAEISALTRSGWEMAPVERVWLLLDFSMFEETNRSLAIPKSRNLRWVAMRYGIASPASLRRPLQYLLGDRGCSTRPYLASGFQNPARHETRGPGTQALFSRTSDIYQATYRRWLAREHKTRERNARSQLEMLRMLIREARARRVQLVLLTAPTHPQYAQILREVGYDSIQRRWHNEIRTLVRAERSSTLFFFDFSLRDRSMPMIDPPTCETAGPPACIFHDPVHFRPKLGRRLLERALPHVGRLNHLANSR